MDHVVDARRHYRDLLRVYLDWSRTAGLELKAERDPEFARFTWHVEMRSEPARDLAAMATGVVDRLLTALDAVAEGLYETGRFDVIAPPTGRVKFPLVLDAASWHNEVSRCVPFITQSDEAVLRSVQPFAANSIPAKAMATLCALSDDGKARPLGVFVVASFADGEGQPRSSTYRTEVLEPVPLTALGTSSQIARVSVSMGRDCAELPQLPVPWSSGFRFDDPPRPQTELAFRTSRAGEVGLNDIKSLIHHVGEVVDALGHQLAFGC